MTETREGRCRNLNFGTEHAFREKVGYFLVAYLDWVSGETGWRACSPAQFHENYREIEPVIENQTQLSPEEQIRVETFGRFVKCLTCGSTDVEPVDSRKNELRCRECGDTWTPQWVAGLPPPKSPPTPSSSGQFVKCPNCASGDVHPKVDFVGVLYCRSCNDVWHDPTIVPPTPSTGLDATLNERGARYGDYASQSDITQSLKDAFRACETGWERLTASQRETLDMVASKIARILNGDPDYVDSWHDIAGYATLVENQLTGKPR